MGDGRSGRSVEDHWTSIYRTAPFAVYETEAPVFDNPDLTRQELELVEAIAEELGTALASPLLDIACGPGRHSLLLARRGHSVVGFDHSEGLLQIASAAAGPAGDGGPSLVCADLHRPPFAGNSFAAAILLGKSFGYFADRQNLAILQGACAVLRPGGFFSLELPDREPYLGSMQPVEREERVLRNGELLHSEYRCRWREESSRLEVHESHVLPATEEIFWEGVWDVRLYDAAEVGELVRSAGFADVAVRETRLVEVQGAKGDVLMVGAVKR